MSRAGRAGLGRGVSPDGSHARSTDHGVVAVRPVTRSLHTCAGRGGSDDGALRARPGDSGADAEAGSEARARERRSCTYMGAILRPGGHSPRSCLYETRREHPWRGRRCRAKLTAGRGGDLVIGGWSRRCPDSEGTAWPAATAARARSELRRRLHARLRDDNFAEGDYVRTTAIDAARDGGQIRTRRPSEIEVFTRAPRFAKAAHRRGPRGRAGELQLCRGFRTCRSRPGDAPPQSCRRSRTVSLSAFASAACSCRTSRCADLGGT